MNQALKLIVYPVVGIVGVPLMILAVLLFVIVGPFYALGEYLITGKAAK